MPKPNEKPENLFVNIICNVVLPSLAFSKLDDLMGWLGAEDALSPTAILLIAISLPIGYGIYDYIKRGIINLFSILGFANVGLTGVIGIAELDGIWVAVKEASLPAVFGIIVLASAKTKNPLIKTLFFNPSVIDVQKVEEIIAERNETKDFDKLFLFATLLFLISSAFSVLMNFVLAKLIVTSPGGTPEFNEQMGRMTWVTYLVILVPSIGLGGFAMWKLYKGIMKLTDLKFEELFHPHVAEKMEETKGKS